MDSAVFMQLAENNGHGCLARFDDAMPQNGFYDPVR
jgi:hypothetical protein